MLKDADLKTAAATAVKARMQNAGQSCIAAKRWIVEKSVAEDFTQQVQSLITSMRQGDPFLPDTDLGPMARPDLAKDLNSQLQNSLWQGAELLAGGEQHNANFSATLLAGVKPGMTAFDEETFGPLAVVITANDEQDAIRLANNTPFGLGSSLWTKDLEKAARLAPLIEAGNVFVNAMVRSDARLPFGALNNPVTGGSFRWREYMSSSISRQCISSSITHVSS